MIKQRILLVEDDPEWASILERCLENSGMVSICSVYNEASEFIKNNIFDLAVIDLEIPDKKDSEKSQELGLKLLQEIRESYENAHCGIIVASHYERHKEAFGEANVDAYFEKDNFHISLFSKTVKEVLINTRLKRAKRYQENRYSLTIGFNDRKIKSSILKGPGISHHAGSSISVKLDIDYFSEEANLINTLISSGGTDQWRKKSDG